MMEQPITRVSEAREEAAGRGCDHGPPVAPVNPCNTLMIIDARRLVGQGTHNRFLFAVFYPL
jgi:hypothetical protein